MKEARLSPRAEQSAAAVRISSFLFEFAAWLRSRGSFEFKAQSVSRLLFEYLFRCIYDVISRTVRRTEGRGECSRGGRGFAKLSPNAERTERAALIAGGLRDAMRMRGQICEWRLELRRICAANRSTDRMWRAHRVNQRLGVHSAAPLLPFPLPVLAFSSPHLLCWP